MAGFCTVVAYAAIKCRSTDEFFNRRQLIHHTLPTCGRVINVVAFLPRDAMLSAVYAVVVCPSVCLSVCVCVCLSHSGIVSKRLNVNNHVNNATR